MLISVLNGAGTGPVSISMSGAADGEVEVETCDGSLFSAVIQNCQLGLERKTPFAVWRIGTIRI